MGGKGHLIFESGASAPNAPPQVCHCRYFTIFTKMQEVWREALHYYFSVTNLAIEYCAHILNNNIAWYSVFLVQYFYLKNWVTLIITTLTNIFHRRVSTLSANIYNNLHIWHNFKKHAIHFSICYQFLSKNLCTL